MSPLAEYFRAERGRIARIAKMTGLPPAFLAQIAAGTRKAPADRCPALEHATDGAFSCDVLRSDVQWVRVPNPEWLWHPDGMPLADYASKCIRSVDAEAMQADPPVVDRRTPEDDGDWIACPARRATDRPELVARQLAPIGRAPEVSDAT